MIQIIILIKPHKDLELHSVSYKGMPSNKLFEAKGVFAAWDMQGKLIYCCSKDPNKIEIYRTLFKAAIEIQSKSKTDESNITPKQT